MMAGNPILRYDSRGLWIVMCTVRFPWSKCVDYRVREDDEDRPLVAEDPLLREMLWAAELDGKPENEWSANEKRRIRKLTERFRLSG
jgi:hypothetical protein